MADIKVNAKTGELAVPQEGGGYRIYAAGQYKQNPKTGQYAVPQEGGQWKIYQHEKKGGFLPLSQNVEGELEFDPTTGILGSILSGVTAPGDVVSGKLDPNSPEGMRRAMDTTGLMLGVNPMVASGDRAIPGIAKSLRPGPVEVPSAQALKGAAEQGYQSMRGMGVDYSTDAVKSVADEALQRLEQEGFRDTFAPNTFSILKELQAPPQDAVVDLVGLNTARKSLGLAAGSKEREEAKAATKAIRELDKFIQEPPPEGVVAGPAAAAGTTLKEANANYAAAMRSDKITGAADQAVTDAATAGSGFNIDNRTRQLLNSILKKQSERRGFSPEEQTLIREIAEGKFGKNFARWIGNYLGGGGGLPANLASLGAAASGMALGGPWGLLAGAIPPAIGAVGRATANKLSQSQAHNLAETLRMRSPLYEQAVKSAPMEPAHMGITDILNRALLLEQLGQEGGQP
jgi:hypothetical protein